MYNFQPSDDSRYAYAVGVIRSKEATLFRKTQWERLLQATSETDLLTSLLDTPYSVIKESTMDSVLRCANVHNWSLFSHLIIEPYIKNFFVVERDYHNLKVLFREEFFSAKISPFLEDGIYKKEELRKLIQGKEHKVEGIIVEAAEKAFIEAIEKKDPFLIDTVVDRFLIKEKLYLAQKSSFLLKLIKYQIDCENIRNFIRLKYFQEENIFEKVFHEEGSLSFKFFKDILYEPIETTGTVIKKNNYPFIEEGIAYLQEKNSFLRLERLLKEYILKWLLTPRYLTFGYEPVVSYFLFKKTEIENLKRINEGIKANLPKEEIKESIAWAE